MCRRPQAPRRAHLEDFKLKRTVRRVIFWTAIPLVASIVGAAAVGVVYWKTLSQPGYVPGGKATEKIMWRVAIFGRKAAGGIPGLSWGELWQMMSHQGGFGMEKTAHEEVRLDASLSNGYDTDEDHQAASQTFRAKCANCHGNNGVGAETGPPLNQPILKYDDSDLAIYEILRDGIPNTAMVAASLSLKQRWQLVGFLRQMQIHEIGLGANKIPLSIQVNSESLRKNESKPDEWLTYSGTLDGRRYTPLMQITSTNASRLRLLWVHKFENAAAVVEATPIVGGGVIFQTVPPSDVVAMDAKTGRTVWRYHRPISSDILNCCGRASQGLAALDNDVFLTTPDGFLVCINANNGRVVWQTQVARPSEGYSMTLAPLTVTRSVVVGVSRRDDGTRGFVAAYEAETGKHLWQFDTAYGAEESATNTRTDMSKSGGGSTWVTGSYDPSLDLIYWGVGGPSPDPSAATHPAHELFTDSIIALHASTGKPAWYFPFTPHDEHHWDSLQTPILADLSMGGSTRKVVCWASRNGFYYVLDRASGKLLAITPFVSARRLDSHGRPVLAADANDPAAGGPLTKPGIGGATTFASAAFDPEKGWLFVPAVETAPAVANGTSTSLENKVNYTTSTRSFFAAETPVLRALDVASGAMKWEYFSPRLPNQTYNFSGLLATRGALVFGASDGTLFAVDSTTGREVWRADLGGDTRAAPISFTVDGSQVIAVSAGRALFLFGL
jgi:alcohol dehydrogenase (cytochrome c)